MSEGSCNKSGPAKSVFVVKLKDLSLVVMELNLGLVFEIGVMKEERPQIKRRADIAPRMKMQPLESHEEDLFLEPNLVAMGELYECL